MPQMTIDCQRMKSINHQMNELHSSLNNVYECLVDREYESLKKEVSGMTKALKLMTESVEDEH